MTNGKIAIPKNVVTVLMATNYELVKAMITDKREFRLVLWNNNNWDTPLPDEIMEKYPNEITLDFKETAFDNSFVDEEGKIVLSTMFADTEYLKVLSHDEILAVIDIETNRAMSLNIFLPRNISIKETDETINNMAQQISKPTNKVTMSNDNIDPATSKRSLEAFKRNNPKMIGSIDELLKNY